MLKFLNTKCSSPVLRQKYVYSGHQKAQNFQEIDYIPLEIVIDKVDNYDRNEHDSQAGVAGVSKFGTNRPRIDRQTDTQHCLYSCSTTKTKMSQI